MQRRSFITQSTLALFVLAATRQAHALTLADLTEKDVSSGIKAALEKGALAAVGMLGQTDGFLGNPKVKIPLPGNLEKAADLLRMTGQGKKVDELVTTMNRAAEAAVPMGKDLLVGAVKSMTVEDAKKIISGGDNAVTTFFADKLDMNSQRVHKTLGGRRQKDHQRVMLAPDMLATVDLHTAIGLVVFESVADQVEENLLEPDGVGDNGQCLLLNRPLHGHACCQHVWGQDGFALVDQWEQVDF